MRHFQKPATTSFKLFFRRFLKLLAHKSSGAAAVCCGDFSQRDRSFSCGTDTHRLLEFVGSEPCMEANLLPFSIRSDKRIRDLPSCQLAPTTSRSHLYAIYIYMWYIYIAFDAPNGYHLNCFYDCRAHCLGKSIEKPLLLTFYDRSVLSVCVCVCSGYNFECTGVEVN